MGLRQWLIRRLLPGAPPFGGRTAPRSRTFGLERGTAIDRWYIERFLAAERAALRGSVLEVGDDSYTRRFGDGRVAERMVLHAVAGNPAATLVGDLATGSGIPDACCDAAILTQVLPFIYDVHGAVRTIHRALRPGGTALITVCGISQISRYDMDRWGDYWRFTDRSLARLLGDVFGPAQVRVASHGNALVAQAFLHGLAVEDLAADDLAQHDPDYQLLLTAVVVKAPGALLSAVPAAPAAPASAAE